MYKKTSLCCVKSSWNWCCRRPVIPFSPPSPSSCGLAREVCTLGGVRLDNMVRVTCFIVIYLHCLNMSLSPVYSSLKKKVYYLSHLPFLWDSLTLNNWERERTRMERAEECRVSVITFSTLLYCPFISEVLRCRIAIMYFNAPPHERKKLTCCCMCQAWVFIPPHFWASCTAVPCSIKHSGETNEKNS